MESKREVRTSSKGKNSKNKDYKKSNEVGKKRSFTALIVFLISAMVVTGIILLFVHPIFNLKDIEIQGTSRYSVEDITIATGLKLNENMFLQAMNKSEVDLSKLPFAKSFEYEYKLPDKIIVKIQERIPIYIAYNKDVNKYYSIDEDGYILEEAKAERTSDEQVFVYGIVFSEDFSFGDKINEIDLSKIACYENIKNEFKDTKIEASITKVSFENALTTITLNDKLNVVFSNDKNLNYLMAFFSEIIKNIGVDTVGTIDMTKPNPTFSIY